MQSQFRQLELAIQSQPMPPEFRDTRATVLCNDCSGKSSTAYHWLGLKCAICASYNTVELQISGGRNGLVATPAPSNLANTPSSQTAQPNPVAIEAAPSSRTEASQITPVGRRRHSSHAGPEARHLMLDRLARSASPAPVPGLPSTAANGAIEEEEEEENDILDLWGRNYRLGSGETDSMSTDMDDEAEYDEEEDDDDDDFEDINLIGHR
ncbi:RING finger and CHY zinc finger domain-containing protein 1 [Colletotrichum chlorophyti]|uniref:RING finger and CHY zinc finger domain-containing protein 1 n=1 Tax=Colletotrichum chlorophyti TaxID=708187 RepID=A0A1Q8RQ42_9PEZI|nr:RING finger and CHY zinc finger domain-containing protein 1 [Colletotrichum chlorophyti]